MSAGLTPFERLRAARVALTERGGPLPALGYRPPIRIGPGGTSGGIPGNQSLPGILSYINVGFTVSGSSEGGGGGVNFSVPLSDVIRFFGGGSGRTKREATVDAARRLLDTKVPALVQLGKSILALAERGVVASGPAFGAALKPLLDRAAQSLADQGYSAAAVKQAVLSIFQRGAAAATIPPALPPLPRPSGLREGYRVIRPPASVAQIATAEAAAVASPYAEAAPAVAAGMVPARALPSWVSSAAQYLGLARAGEGAVKLLRGQPLSLPEFGALAGTVLGALVADPVMGAEVGFAAGEGVQELDRLSRQYLGESLDTLLGQAGRSALDLLRSQPQPAPQPVPTSREIVTQPQPAPVPLSREITVQPQPAPQPLSREITVQPQPAPVPLSREITVQPQPAPQPVPLEKPCPNCPPPGPQDCPPEVQLLLSQIENCPPEILKQIGDKILQNYHVVQRPGHQPEIVSKQPVCLCCESAADFNAYVESGGATGNCQQVVGADASIVGRK